MVPIFILPNEKKKAYFPLRNKPFLDVARLTGIEPVTPSFGNWYSIQLSYRRVMQETARRTPGHFTSPRPNDPKLPKLGCGRIPRRRAA